MNPTDPRIHRRRALGMLSSLGLLSGWAAAPAWAADAGAHNHDGHAMAGMQDVKRSENMVALPSVSMTRQDGKKLPIAKALDDGRPVVLNFIYTSCTAICPVLSQTFAEMRERLGAERSRVNMVSISIDPDYDTPARLKEYAARFGADANWNFYTGTLEDSIAIQKAFASYRGDKMNHAANTFMRSAAPGKAWLRVDGFAGPARLLTEYRKLTSSS